MMLLALIDRTNSLRHFKFIKSHLRIHQMILRRTGKQFLRRKCFLKKILQEDTV